MPQFRRNKSHPTVPVSTGQTRGLTLVEKSRLCTLLGRNDSLAGVQAWIERLGCQQLDGKPEATTKYVCQSGAGSQLLLALGSPYLTASLVPRRALPLLDKLCADRHLTGSDYQTLMELSPVVASAALARSVQDEHGRLQEACVPLLRQLMSISPVPSDKRNGDARNSFEDLKADPNWSATQEWWRAAKFFPAHPRVRQQVLVHTADDAITSETSTCPKGVPQRGKQTPGLLIVCCPEHGRIIGFEVMDFNESVRTVFRLLTTRWSDMPDVVFYDNACNLHTFCAYREPILFQDVQFIIDKLHWSSHSKCSPVFNPNLYSHLVFLNTQLCEQINSEIQRQAPHLYHFKRTMFLFHLRSDLRWLNTKKRAALEAKLRKGRTAEAM